jgi:hypothetical protein
MQYTSMKTSLNKPFTRGLERTSYRRALLSPLLPTKVEILQNLLNELVQIENKLTVIRRQLMSFNYVLILVSANPSHHLRISIFISIQQLKKP